MALFFCDLVLGVQFYFLELDCLFAIQVWILTILIVCFGLFNFLNTNSFLFCLGGIEPCPPT